MSTKSDDQDVPIYIGATGMQMMQLTGEIADGAVLNYLVSPEYNRQAVENLEIGAAKAGDHSTRSIVPNSSCAPWIMTARRRSTAPASLSRSTWASSRTS